MTENKINTENNVELNLDWEDLNGTEVEGKVNINDSLIYSLSNKGRVDLEYMESVTDHTKDEIIEGLRGHIFQNPGKWEGDKYAGWETKDEYVSGNLMKKWEEAKIANLKNPGLFDSNLEVLKDQIPKNVSYENIYVSLGTPWLPADIVDEFIVHLFGKSNAWWLEGHSLSTLHDEQTGSWEIPEKSRYQNSVAVSSTYGTSRLNGLQIIEKTLNMKTVQVFDEVVVDRRENKTSRVLNHQETVLALEKQDLIKDEFAHWIWKDRDRRNRLEAIYEEKFTSFKTRKYDGSYLLLPDLDKSVNLYKYQKDAVSRIILSPNVLLAHDVGSGKTYEMVVAGHELRRLGMSKKNMYVVPNNVIGQWKDMYLKCYPNSELLVIEPYDFRKNKRQEIMEEIQSGDYEAIIMAYSCFDMIPISKKFIENEINEKLEELKKIRSNKRTKKTNLKITSLSKELEKEQEKKIKFEGLFFDELGVDRLFVDEAHNYKNVELDTQVDRVFGISKTGSEKCRQMYEKVKCVQKMNGGGGVVFATGTPITNSLSDAFVMQKYLQSGELSLTGLDTFDSWIGNFAERSTEFEIDVDTSSYRLATRFSKFHNLPELTSLLSSVADFHQLDKSADIPDFDGYTDVLVEKPDELKVYLEWISERAEKVRTRKVKRTEDNMLKITTDGRKAALDIRLTVNDLEFSRKFKAYLCAKNVYLLYCRFAEQKATQLIFCDSSVPKPGFNMYTELKRILVALGVNSDDIAFIHDYEKESEKEELFRKMREGEIRILIGSTPKLGLGVNVQTKLIALHHLDIPWRPADMVQREGRILRTGNTNEKVYIYRYITEGSFDAYSWQLLETKQNFISAILSGSLTERSGSDIQDVVLNYAEVKALAIGNPKIKKRVEVANELSRLYVLQRKEIEKKYDLENELSKLPEHLSAIEHKGRLCKADCEVYASYLKSHPRLDENDPLYEEKRRAEIEERKDIRETIHKILFENFNSEEDVFIMDYKGFALYVPKLTEKPVIKIVGNMEYELELGDRELGYNARLDNFLYGLNDQLTQYRSEYARYKKRQEDIKVELEKDEHYGERIEQCKIELEKLDKELGVKTDE